MIVYLARLAPGSRRTMAGALRTVAAMLAGEGADPIALPWHLVRYQHTQAIRAALGERYAPATANKHLAALRGVLKEAWRLGLLGAEEYQQAADVGDIRAATLPRGRALTPGELRALFGACADGTLAGIRDAALLAVLYGCGLRRAEAVGLDSGDYHPETRALTVRHGKGEKARIVYLPASGAALLAAWLLARLVLQQHFKVRTALLLRCSRLDSTSVLTRWVPESGSAAVVLGHPGPLFLPINKGGRMTFRRMAPQSIYDLLARRTAAAAVMAVSPHDLRRTFVSDLLDAGVDLGTVQKLAGHASIATTTRYDRRGEHAKRQAADVLHIPTG